MDNDHNPLNVKVSHEDLRSMYRDDMISEQQYLDALHYSGIIPDKHHWRSFLQVLLSSLGTVFLLTGILFFFAFNWAEMSKWQKFAGIELFIILAALFAWIKGPHKLSGKLGTLAAGTLIGVLMAVYGQIYQTGADPYELFMYWGIILLPLVVAVRLPAFWIMWMVIVNLAISLYVEQGLGGGIYLDYTPHFLVALNLVFLVVWNFMQSRQIKWMQEPWTNWIVAIACLVAATMMAGMTIENLPHEWSEHKVYNTLSALLYIVVAGGFFYFYQFVKRDLFILSLVIISVCILSFVLYFEFVTGNSNFRVQLLVLSIMVLGEAAVAAIWLRRTHLKWSVHS